MATSKGKTAAANVAAPTRCEQGGPEIIPPGPIRVRQADVVTFVLFVCKSPARVRLDLDTTVLTDSQVVDGMSKTLPAMAPGIHALIWSELFAAEDWQTRTEVLVNDTPAFRQRKSSAGSTFPVNRGFVVLEVVP